MVVAGTMVFPGEKHPACTAHFILCEHSHSRALPVALRGRYRRLVTSLKRNIQLIRKYFSFVTAPHEL